MWADYLQDVREIRHAQDCQHLEWRWLECDECEDKGEDCDLKICVACNASLP